MYLGSVTPSIRTTPKTPTQKSTVVSQSTPKTRELVNRELPPPEVVPSKSHHYTKAQVAERRSSKTSEARNQKFPISSEKKREDKHEQ